jgi:hypothetical protein
MSKQAESKLAQLLTQIFEDNVVTVAERAALLEVQASGELTTERIQAVFSAFLDEKWGEALADGRVTEQEKLVLRRVTEELELPDAAVPLQLRMALKH